MNIQPEQYGKLERDFVSDIAAAEDFEYLYQVLDKEGGIAGVGMTYKAEEIKNIIESFREQISQGPFQYPTTPTWMMLADTEETKILKAKISELVEKEYAEAVSGWVMSALSFDELYDVIERATTRFGLRSDIEAIREIAKTTGAMPDDEAFKKLSADQAVKDKVIDLIAVEI